ncbi:MAG TPA: hypothetical protein VLZ11_01880 [Flavobacterium sp.]|nr:hypothetical protein [Flavobacterium sp.]
MTSKHCFICLLSILLFCSKKGFAQVQTKQIEKDTITKTQEKNLLNLEKKAEVKGGMRLKMHQLIFRPIKKDKNYKPVVEAKISYRKYEGKIIRNINVVTLDPFGFSITDTTAVAENWAEKFGNSIHIKSKENTIKNLLLFSPDDKLDSLIIKESERLVRKQGYIRKVLLEPVAVSTTSDSVDINIRVLDSWSLTANGSISSSNMDIEISETNFMGFGHTFDNNYKQNFKNPKSAYGARYVIPNIKNTHINSVITYDIDLDNDYQKSFELGRGFFSPLTKWAGGVYVDERFKKDSLPDPSGVFDMQNFKTRNQNYWVGRSFRLSKGTSEEDRTLSLITTLGGYHTSYSEHPTDTYDPTNFFSNQSIYLSSIGVASRQFVQDRYLFEYDRIEDIAIGRTYLTTFGIRQKNDKTDVYLAYKYSFGNYFDFGFLGADFEIGSFFERGNTKEGALKISGIYFSRLYQYGSWYFRQFVQPEIVMGFNRDQNIKDQLFMEGSHGISAFTSKVMGTKKAVISFQTQSYSPGIWYGFRFSPFFNFTAGMLGDKENTFLDSRLYTKFGLGVLISNDFLIFNQFQISIAYYPSIPFEGTHMFRTNTFRNDDINLQNFSIEQPEIIKYE